jgi:hypothetical protein
MRKKLQEELFFDWRDISVDTKLDPTAVMFVAAVRGGDMTG